MFGIQWDLVLKYIETKNPILGDTTKNIQYKLKTDSSSWGNYKNISFTVTNTNAKYSNNSGVSYNQVSAEGYEKPNSYKLLTTGATERNSAVGIFDLAGNVEEWTLEKTINSNNHCSYRGGSYGDSGSDGSASDRSDNTSGSSDNIGFRPALY